MNNIFKKYSNYLYVHTDCNIPTGCYTSSIADRKDTLSNLDEKMIRFLYKTQNKINFTKDVKVVDNIKAQNNMKDLLKGVTLTMKEKKLLGLN
jgi:hypothetical protein